MPQRSGRDLESPCNQGKDGAGEAEAPSLSSIGQHKHHLRTAPFTSLGRLERADLRRSCPEHHVVMGKSRRHKTKIGTQILVEAAHHSKHLQRAADGCRAIFFPSPSLAYAGSLVRYHRAFSAAFLSDRDRSIHAT